ncbi:MAG: zeta toxin family protein [Bacteroidales bacterium]|jgi:predicted ABC-type ATPase|nr:zeta toxin family protein [Bacteroidales bacterium]
MNEQVIDKPKLLIVAGPNGSGKTSVTSKILKHIWIEGCQYINPDNIAQEVFGDWNSYESVMKAVQYAEKMREDCLLNKQSLIFETVLSAPDKIEYIKRAKEAGFFIRLFFIGTDTPQINAARVAKRVMNGGHDVPIHKIISRYNKSIVNCALMSCLVDRLYVYDNSVDYAPPTLLFRLRDGKLVRQYTDLHRWAMPIFEQRYV